nr:CPBP family intramembrane glutamic endopeptidase [Roseibacterium persicicum]
MAPVIFLWVLAFSVAGEETGWRGYLLPRLLDRLGPLAASLVLGLAWSLWHLPLWALPGDFHAGLPVSLFLIQSLALSVVYTRLWLASSGSLIVAHLFHAASNTTLGLLPLIPGAGGEGLRALWIAVALLCALAAVLAARQSRRDGARAAAAHPRAATPEAPASHGHSPGRIENRNR